MTRPNLQIGRLASQIIFGVCWIAVTASLTSSFAVPLTALASEQQPDEQQPDEQQDSGVRFRLSDAAAPELGDSPEFGSSLVPIVHPLPDPSDAAWHTDADFSIDSVVEEVFAEILQTPAPLDFYQIHFQEYSAYRTHQTSLSWVPGSHSDLGWLAWHSDPYLTRGSSAGIVTAFNFHWLSGPASPDVSPRLYDAIIGYQVRRGFSERFSYDVAASVGVFSDFAGSARKGVRFPAHAVGMLHLNQRLDLVFGVDYLDRGDLKLLPVVGFSMREVLGTSVRLDLVFPRPRVDFLLDERHRIYLTALLGGGTWDFKYPDDSRDLLSYRDYRVMLGFEAASGQRQLSAIELGYAFSRQVELKNIAETIRFDDAFVIHWIARF